MALPDDVAAAVGARDAGWALLVQFAFLSEVKRVWTGFGDLRTPDGRVWSGLGEVIGVDGLQGPLSGSAPAGKVTVSGVSPSLVPIALSELDEYTGRPVAFFFAVFANRSLIGGANPLGLRIMTTLQIDRTGETRTMSINHESPYVGRNNPANGWYTDRDQQSRYHGDRFCERTPFLLFKQERWPDY
jgi:hypothetical protein